MANVQHVGAEFFAALDTYVQAASSAAREASREALTTLQQHLLAAAEIHPAWKGVSDSIEMWNDEEGELLVGVRNPDVIDLALDAEFGTKERPPAPILRNKEWAERDAQQRLRFVWGSHMGALR